MTLQLDLKPETERSLRQAAEALKIPVEEYALSVLESRHRSNIIPARNPAKTPEEVAEWLKTLSQFSDRIPDHPGQTWSREVIYDDHD